MSGAATGEGSYVYAVSCRRLGLLKIGVADDPGKRLRELQVGSPAELTLAYMQPYAERRDAVAVCEELYRCFAGRRDRGRWYRLTLEEVRHGLARRATVEAPQRARAAEAARESRVAAGRRKRLGGRTEKQLAYERRRRQQRTRLQKRAARLRAAGWRQDEIAAAVEVTTRTLRNWKSAPAYRRELERQRARGGRKPASAPASERKPRPQRRATQTRPDRHRRADRAAGRQPEPAPAPATSEPAIELDDGVPIFPDTTEGRSARLLYYEARKLNNLPSSGYDYTDARRGEAPLRERQARQRRDSRRRQ
jgi:hypothetical protein